MAYSVTNLKSEITGFIHGTTLNKVVALDQLIYRAARQLLLDLDPQETKRIQPIASAIYSKVYDYPLPVDVKSNKVIDIRPQANRQATDYFNQSYSKQFDLGKDGQSNQFNINFNSGLKTIRISDPGLVQGVVLNEVDSLTGNGAWTAGGTASNLAIDNVNYVSGSSSLKFDLGVGTGWLETSNMTAQDISTWVNQANQFLYTYLQTGTGISSISIRWGSSSTNYYEQSASVTQQNTAFQNGWNLMSFPWLNATVVGSPDPSNISYLRVTWVATTAQTGMHLDNIVCRLGTILEIVYYSKYLFRDLSTGGWQETITDDTNLINLDTESYNLLVYQVGIHLAQQLQGADAMVYDGVYFQQHYIDALTRYRNQIKSEIQKPESVWYSLPKSGYTRFVNWRIPR